MKRTDDRPLRVALASLGCSKNLVDSEILLAHLVQEGFLITAEASSADILIVNTCGFIPPAREESKSAVREFAAIKRQDPRKKLLVFGCMVERFSEELKRHFPEIDSLMGVLSPERLRRLSAFLKGERPARGSHPPDWLLRLRLTPPHYSYLRIAEGCDNRCTYCLIPSMRGPFRSRRLEEIIEEANLLAKSGVVELNIIAQDTTNYGGDLPGRPTLVSLLERLEKITAFRWIRLLYAHPANFSRELVDYLSSSRRLLPYLDLPLQHISDRILKAMGRRISRTEIEALIDSLRSRVPGLVLRTTFIVGFPGETEKEFRELLDFARKVGFERLGCFMFSPEKGTPAARMRHQVPLPVRRQRLDRLMRLQQEIAFERNRRLLGRQIQVLVDRRAGNGAFSGRTYADAPEVDPQVRLSGKGLVPGRFVFARVKATAGYDLVAEASSEEKK